MLLCTLRRVFVAGVAWRVTQTAVAVLVVRAQVVVTKNPPPALPSHPSWNEFHQEFSHGGSHCRCRGSCTRSNAHDEYSRGVIGRQQQRCTSIVHGGASPACPRGGASHVQLPSTTRQIAATTSVTLTPTTSDQRGRGEGGCLLRPVSAGAIWASMPSHPVLTPVLNTKPNP